MSTPKENPSGPESSKPVTSLFGNRSKLKMLLDVRVWIGIAITVGSVWYAARGIPIDSVWDAMRQVNFLQLLLLSLPWYVLAVYFRALRWRHLARPIKLFDRALLFRCTSLGLMANNLLPLRAGEFVRSWTLSKEGQAPLGGIVGTLVLERTLDALTILFMAFVGLTFMGQDSHVSGVLREGAKLLVPLAVIPVAGLAVLRLAPEFSVKLTRALLRPLPEWSGIRAESVLRNFIQGLGALGGGWHLFWIVLHSLLIWLVASSVPILIGLWAFDIDLGSAVVALFSSWVLLAALGVAVALPSAPGFIGPYQLAFKAVLVDFGVEPAKALAAGIVVWSVMWLIITLQGLVFLRTSHRRLPDPVGPSA